MDSGEIAANLNADNKKLIAEINQRIAFLSGVEDRLFARADFISKMASIDVPRYNNMTAQEQQSQADQDLKGKIDLERSAIKNTIDILQLLDSEIKFLNDFKVKVNQAFANAVASIRKDYSTSGGPGHEIYQNDNFYFV